MRLKRLYDHTAPHAKWGTIARPCRDCNGRKKVVINDEKVDCPTCKGKGKIDQQVPPVRGVEVQQTSPVQHFSERVVAGGLAEGWLVIGDGRITIRNAIGDDVVYRIVRAPGWYCCHDGKKLNNSDEGREYVDTFFKGVPSPDPNNPSGWCRIHHYVGERE